MSNHTPGQWKVAGDPLVPNRFLIEKRANGWKTFIAEVYGDEDHQGGKDFAGNREANARLIAAAPDLLEACKDALESLTCIVNPRKPNPACDCYCCESAKIVRAAIAKANGTAPDE